MKNKKIVENIIQPVRNIFRLKIWMALQLNNLRISYLENSINNSN